MSMLRQIPFMYVLKNVVARRLTAGLTALGMALVVYVFATAMMLTEGLRKTLVDSGSYDNAMVIRRSAQTEVQSDLGRDQAAIVEASPEIASRSGEPLVSKESLVLMTLTKRGTIKPANVTLRGVSPNGLLLRPQVRVLKGRFFQFGTSEIIAGRKIAERFVGAGLGERLRFGLREWTVTGIYDAGNTAFGSEIWGDAEQFMQAFRRQTYSSVLFKLADPRAFDIVKRRLEADSRLKVDVKREPEFYAEQSWQLATFLRLLGIALSTIFSIGAIIGAMITMYAAVANRTREIGTLRAIGFRRWAILLAFMLEALALGCLGGILGLIPASAMQWLTISTMNFQTFSELAFSFTLTPAIIVQSLVFGVVMGFIGGFLPAVRAARMKIVDSLRAA
jgi:putative ABC transport system permease protein